MAKKGKGGFYAVKVGRQTGIFSDWATCEMQVKGFEGAQFKKCDTKEEADIFIGNQTSSAIVLDQTKANVQVPAGAPYYAVRVGHKPGIYRDWPSASKQISNYPGAKHKKFTTEREAKEWLREIPWLDPLSETQTNTTTAATATTSTTTTTTAAASKGKKRASSALEEDTGCDVVYTDGACKGNGKIGSLAGLGVWWGHNDSRNISERCPGGQTNNRGELMAILRVLETAPITKKPLKIHVDSQYCIDCFTKWLRGWIRNGYKTSKGGPVLNLSLILYIQAHLDLRKKSGQVVELLKVKGHSGVEGNEGADGLAVAGSLLPEVPEPDWDSLKADVLKKINDLETAPSAPQATAATSTIPKSPPKVPATPSKVRKLSAGPSASRVAAQRLAQAPIDLDLEPEPPQTPRHATRIRKLLPSASERHAQANRSETPPSSFSERYAEARRRALLIYPLLPEEMEQEQVEAIQSDYVEVPSPRASPSPSKPSTSKGKRGISTKASASQSARAHQPRPIASSSRVQLPSAPNGMAVDKSIDENELNDYAAGLLDDDNMFDDL